MASNEKYTILYARLSQEDMQKRSGREDDSNSIRNQRILLEKYAADKGFTNILFKQDDGYSGTNFNRPGWLEVMELVEAGKVSAIIVKDMSRLGREYLQVGQYTELLFPSYGIRFIAVNDGVDSLYEQTNDFTPFRNIMNEFYAKDCSKKSRSAIRTKAETGARIGSRAPYGYQKDPDDPKRHIIPDPDTAWVVKHIFELCAQGSGPTQIAKQLEQNQILTPAQYYLKKYGKAPSRMGQSRPCQWSASSVVDILEDESYLGVTVSLKHTTISYKNKTRISRPVEEQLRFENTHEPLVDKQTWEIVQEIRKHKRRRDRFEEQNMFSGLVYCADCGGTLILTRAHTLDPAKNSFRCSTYKKKGKEVCSAHYIREVELTAVVLDDLRRVTHFARQNENRFAQYIGVKLGKEAQREIGLLQRQIIDMERRKGELTALFKRLYEDNVLGRIPDEQYRILSQDYTEEQAKINDMLPDLKDRLQKKKDAAGNVSRFLENARKYTHIDALTPEILHTFIKRIEIGERARRYDRNAPQEIRIYYRDIGLIDELPETMLPDGSFRRPELSASTRSGVA